MKKNNILKKYDLNILRKIISSNPCTKIFPREFFIAWSGVPVLAYKRFSNTIVNIKTEIEKNVHNLEEEKPGSKWPKTSLGALSEDRILKMQDFKTLFMICEKVNRKMPLNDGIPIDKLQIVVSLCRSLERRLITSEINLLNDDTDCHYSISTDQIQKVDSVLNRFDKNNLNNYFKEVITQKNDIIHYRDDYSQVVLVFDLPIESANYIDDFVEECEKKLPGYFAWFDRGSLHITIRKMFVYRGVTNA